MIGSLRQEPELLRSMMKAVTLRMIVVGRRRILQKTWIWSRVSAVLVMLLWSHLHSPVATP